MSLSPPPHLVKFNLANLLKLVEDGKKEFSTSSLSWVLSKNNKPLDFTTLTLLTSYMELEQIVVKTERRHRSTKFTIIDLSKLKNLLKLQSEQPHDELELRYGVG
jgi:hypothetical protein